MKLLNKIYFPMLLSMMVMLGPFISYAEQKNVHSFTVESINGDQISLSDYEGKALLIVNTASRCGYTPQYKSMESLYSIYKEQGLEVLAFPANNFGGQEPGTNDQIKNFCLMKYKTTFPLFAKSSVKGDNINPLYKYLTQESSFDGDISWNFNKFLVDPNGEVVARFPSNVDPLSSQLVKKIEDILPQ